MDEALKSDARRYLVEVEGFKGIHVDEFLDGDDFEKMYAEGILEYHDLVRRYKEFRAYTIEEIGQILKKRLAKFVFTPRRVIDHMGLYEMQMSSSGFNGFFLEAEKEGRTIECLIREAIISILDEEAEDS